MTKALKKPLKNKSMRSPASKLAANKAKRQRQNGVAEQKDGERERPGSTPPPSLVRLFDDASVELHNLVTNRSGYFTQKASGSTKSVSELGITLANESELRASVARLPERLQAEKQRLVQRYLSNARRMASQWYAGFSLLFYGYGSKYELLKSILKECSVGFPAVLIDGLSTRITYKSILMNVLATARDCKTLHLPKMNEEELLAEIKEEAKHQRIFVMVSNIEGPSLRSPNVQRGLSELSQIEKLHFGASIDHVNAPLVWDLQMKDRFSWVWHHVPTFKPYVREVNMSSLPSLFLGRKEACTQESAAVVLSSLSNNAREVFRCIADAQLDAENASGGITFQTLFNVCKERFLASNENILKAFLTEFKDHDILQTKRDGSTTADVLHIPLDDNSLRTLLSLC